MDPAILLTIFSGAIAALFGALLLSLRQQREDWKALYEKSDGLNQAANAELRQQSATASRLVELTLLQRQEAEDIRREPQRRRSTDG